MGAPSCLIALMWCLASLVLAQEPSIPYQGDPQANKPIYLPLQTGDNHTFCPYYVPNGTSQWEYMYRLVYRAFTGQYKPNTNASLYQAQGILNSSAYYTDPAGNTSRVNLLPWFDGSLQSSNRCGRPASVRLVEGDGLEWRGNELRIRATPAMHVVLSRITEYMGVILGCNEATFPTYSGRPSQFDVHRFMDLAPAEMHYFIHNLYDSALTSGVSQPDGVIIGTALDNMFNKRCAPARRVAAYQPPELQNMCLHEGCATWQLANETCAAYDAPGVGVPPSAAGKSQHGEGYGWRCTPAERPDRHCNGNRLPPYRNASGAHGKEHAHRTAQIGPIGVTSSE